MNRYEKTWKEVLEDENSFLSEFNCDIKVDKDLYEDEEYSVFLGHSNMTEIYASCIYEDKLSQTIQEASEYLRGLYHKKRAHILVDQVLLNDAIWEYNTNVSHYSTEGRAWEELKRRYEQELEYCKNEDREVSKAEISEGELFARIETPAYTMFLSVETVVVNQ